MLAIRPALAWCWFSPAEKPFTAYGQAVSIATAAISNGSLVEWIER